METKSLMGLKNLDRKQIIPKLKRVTRGTNFYLRFWDDGSVTIFYLDCNKLLFLLRRSLNISWKGETTLVGKLFLFKRTWVIKISKHDQSIFILAQELVDEFLNHFKVKCLIVQSSQDRAAFAALLFYVLYCVLDRIENFFLHIFGDYIPVISFFYHLLSIAHKRRS